MEVERVYALYGRANSGKTSTLNNLIDRFDINKKLFIEDVNSNDRIAIFKTAEKIIGIFTIGDVEAEVKSCFEKLEEESKKLNVKLDIVFCATRTSGGTCEYVNNRFGRKLIWVHIPYIDNNEPHEHKNSGLYKARNELMGNLLYSFILNK